MRGQRYWYSNGVSFREVVTEAVELWDPWQKFSREGQVRVTTGPHGSEVKWVLDAPNVTNLSAVCLNLTDFPTPFILRYFVAGWFEEILETAERAVHRIQDLMLRGDRFLGRRTFIKECEPSSETMPTVLLETWQSGVPPEDSLIECTYDPGVQHFVVEKVGARSPIGRIWGTGPTSGPCVPIGAFDASVSRSYEQVITQGKPRYDEIVAAFLFPDNTVRWVPYHRLVMPVTSFGGNSKRVWVIAEIAKVSFEVI